MYNIIVMKKSNFHLAISAKKFLFHLEMTFSLSSQSNLAFSFSPTNGFH